MQGQNSPAFSINDPHFYGHPNDYRFNKKSKLWKILKIFEFICRWSRILLQCMALRQHSYANSVRKERVGSKIENFALCNDWKIPLSFWSLKYSSKILIRSFKTFLSRRGLSPTSFAYNQKDFKKNHQNFN